jgi:hypothetical protein
MNTPHSNKFRWVCELAVTSLFAVVFSYIATRIVHALLRKEAPEIHPFNHTETFLTGYLTAMTMFILIRHVDWKTGLSHAFETFF